MSSPLYECVSNNFPEHSLKETPYRFKFGPSIPSGSIIFPKRGASILLNKVRILIAESYMDTNLMTLTISKEIDNEFCYYSLMHNELWRIADTTSIPQINNKHIVPYGIVLPQTKSEQTGIATALSDADALIQSLEKLVSKKTCHQAGSHAGTSQAKSRLGV
ncbi:MAG: restriction endonuclease subunit S [Paenibacillaceae bacterium]